MPGLPQSAAGLRGAVPRPARAAPGALGRQRPNLQLHYEIEAAERDAGAAIRKT